MNFDENLADFGCGIDEESSLNKNAAAFLKSYARTCTVFTAVNEAESLEKKHEIVKSYLDFCYDCREGKIHGAKNTVNISLNGPGFESITSSRLPDLQRDSTSTLHLLEFFTHCCINCIHSIEDVRQVHEEVDSKFETKGGNGFKGLKVLSVHSPKFPREKDIASIKAFCKRNRMDHSEVVNDPDCLLWNELGVTCWPTLLILGPNPDGKGPNLLFNFMGEGHKNDLLLTLSTCMEYFNCNIKLELEHTGGEDAVDATVNSAMLNDSGSDPKKFLRFPGKVVVHSNLIVISDSGNNRLVLARPNGEVIDVVGGSGVGCRDGSFSEAQFYNPQGIAFESESVLYVADTGNHAIRKVDLASKRVFTFINPGRVIRTGEESESLKSPWDLTFYDRDTLIVAAAGNHRILGYFFNNETLFGVKHDEGTFSVISGTGREENRNNSYLLKASFAQPSGICAGAVANGEKSLYLADSESSSIRSITGKGQVVGIVGGSRDPTDLFAFGDVDGKGFNAKLQHPMGVCPGANPSEIFVADTYNHKIKKIDVTTKDCTTVIAEGFNEPSGIFKDPERDILYVADTNNHSIKLIDMQTWKVTEMELGYQKHEDVKQLAPHKFDKLFEVSLQGATDSMTLNFTLSPLPEAYEGGHWRVLAVGSLKFEATKGTIDKQTDINIGHFSVVFSNLGESRGQIEFYVVADIFFCSANSCLKRTRKIKVANKQDSTALNEYTLEWSNLTWDN